MSICTNTRDDIIKNAVLEKLSEGINIFTCDDILTVAGIDDAQLQAIAETIKTEASKAGKGSSGWASATKSAAKRKRK